MVEPMFRELGKTVRDSALALERSAAMLSAGGEHELAQHAAWLAQVCRGFMERTPAEITAGTPELVARLKCPPPRPRNRFNFHLKRAWKEIAKVQEMLAVVFGGKQAWVADGGGGSSWRR